MALNTGVRDKPQGCKLCPLQYLGTGFCPDYVPPTPKMMLLLESPYSDDVINQMPLSGSMGDFLESKILKPANLKREDLLIANTLRCKFTKDKYDKDKLNKKENNRKDYRYPSGKIKGQAENNCRQFDINIRNFNPTLFLMTFGIDDSFNDAAYISLMQHDIKRAKWLAETYTEEHVCILMGKNAISMVNDLPLSDGKGGLRSWHGSYFKGKWRYD